MAKVKVSQYDATAASNTDVANINIAEGCSPSNINNAIRAVMGHLKDFQAGNVTGNALAVAGGGTGAENAADARTNLGLGTVATLNSITSAYITDGTIDTVDLADDAVTSAKIADGTIVEGNIANDAITSAKIATDAVDATALNVSGNGTSGQVLLSDGDGSFSWGDTITKTTGSAPYYASRAWVNFNGTGTVAIRSSANVSSITDNGTGDYRVNFSTNMPDTNYSVIGTISDISASTGQTVLHSAGRNVAYAIVHNNYQPSGSGLTYYDAETVSVAIHR